MITIGLLVGLVAVVIGLGGSSWSSWRWRLTLYAWGTVLALVGVIVLPIVMSEMWG